MRYMIAYDVSHDGDRARIAALLAAWGDRIQRSVFECTIETDELATLEREIGKLVDVQRDSVHFVPVCANCDDARRLFGQAFRPEETWCWVV